MNRFIGLIITVVAVAALVGAAIGWRFPFLGRNQRATQQIGNTAQNGSQRQSNNRTPAQPNTTQDNPSASGDTLDPESPNTQPEQNTSSGTASGTAPAALW
jgi:cytoskeletal protein RodZ